MAVIKTKCIFCCEETSCNKEFEGFILEKKKLSGFPEPVSVLQFYSSFETVDFYKNKNWSLVDFDKFYCEEHSKNAIEKCIISNKQSSIKFTYNNGFADAIGSFGQSLIRCSEDLMKSVLKKIEDEQIIKDIIE